MNISEEKDKDEFGKGKNNDDYSRWERIGMERKRIPEKKRDLLR